MKIYDSYEDLVEKLGYKRYKPRIGVLGRALLEASRNQRSDNFLKKFWDFYFKRERERRKRKNDKNKQNS